MSFHEGIILAFKNMYGTTDKIEIHKYYSTEQNYYWKFDGRSDVQETVDPSWANSSSSK